MADRDPAQGNISGDLNDGRTARDDADQMNAQQRTERLRPFPDEALPSDGTGRHRQK